MCWIHPPLRTIPTTPTPTPTLLKINKISLKEALASLQSLVDEVPREGSVHFLLGKVHQQLGDTHTALKHYVIALDVGGRDATQIKAAIDGLCGNENVSFFFHKMNTKTSVVCFCNYAWSNCDDK